MLPFSVLRNLRGKKQLFKLKIDIIIYLIRREGFVAVACLNSDNLGRGVLNGIYSFGGGCAGTLGSIILTNGTTLALQSGGITTLSVTISNLALYILKSLGVELNFGIKCLSDIATLVVVLLGASALGVTCPIPLMVASLSGAIFIRLLLDGPCREPWERDPFS